MPILLQPLFLMRGGNLFAFPLSFWKRIAYTLRPRPVRGSLIVLLLLLKRKSFRHAPGWWKIMEGKRSDSVSLIYGGHSFIQSSFHLLHWGSFGTKASGDGEQPLNSHHQTSHSLSDYSYCLSCTPFQIDNRISSSSSSRFKLSRLRSSPSKSILFHLSGGWQPLLLNPGSGSDVPTHR